MGSFTHAGVSRLNGKMKVRYANDAMRVKILIKNGHTDIDLVELKYPSTKEDALRFLFTIDFADGNPEVQDAMHIEAVKRGVTRLLKEVEYA